MRILLDESLPRPLSRLLVRHDVSTVALEGWARLNNGALLRQAAMLFDVVLTADQNIEFQQNLATLPIAVVVLAAESNRLESLEPLVPVTEVSAISAERRFRKRDSNVQICAFWHQAFLPNGSTEFAGSRRVRSE